ncbi:Retrotransposon gag domain - like 10 [Theobroma cacao]|nr:Retrotransposon gag domain - like 10 [Theobroma cacao]
MAEDNNNNGNNAINLVPDANRALRDYAVPLLQVNFLKICDTFKYNGVTDDAIRLRLFPFSLRDKAKSWLNSLPNGSITTWEDLAQKFLAKFFPPTKTAKLRNNITSFTQFDGESLYEAWERFKELLQRCPHHGIPDWLQVQAFYNGLVGSIKTTIDAAAGGALMSKNAADAYNLLEEMASNNYQWPSKRSSSRKAVGAYEIDAISNLAAFKFTKALCDLGADRTIKYLVGIIEDVLVKVGHLYIPVDFIVLEMEEDLEVSLILG